MLHWLVSILFAGSVLFPPSARAEELPAPLRKVGFEQRLDAELPLDLAFRDESGRSVRLGDFFGQKAVVLAMVYYECPMLCTLTLSGLVSALRALSFDVGREFEVVTVSFSPSETPELAARKKAAYLKEYRRAGAERGWHFLTGEAASIAALGDAVGFRYEYVPEQKQYAHAAGLIVITPRGRVARYFFGVEFSPRDLRLGLIEASEERIGNAVDQLLLYCFQYDPAHGKYGAAIMNVLRLGGGLTVAAVATFLAVMLRRERREARRLRPAEAGGGFRC